MFDEREISQRSFNSFAQTAILIKAVTLENRQIKVIVDRGIEQWNAGGSALVARDQITSLAGADAPSRGDYVDHDGVLYEIRNRISSDSFIVVLEAIPLGDSELQAEAQAEYAI
jgi:hypothetical protein